MAKDVKDAGDTIGAALGTIVREVSQSVSSNGDVASRMLEEAYRRGQAERARSTATPSGATGRSTQREDPRSA